MKRGKKLTGIAAFLAAVGLVFASCGDGGGGGSGIEGENCHGTGCRAIGSTGPGGGIIIYHKHSGFTVTGEGSFTAYYLEAASTNQATGIMWSNYSTTDILGTKTVVGTGKENTRLILVAYANASAAKAAKVTIGGKSDWFLPSKDELNEMYKARTHLGISSGIFWSSSQSSKEEAWMQYFSSGNQYETSKSDHLGINVRAVRYF